MTKQPVIRYLNLVMRFTQTDRKCASFTVLPLRPESAPATKMASIARTLMAARPAISRLAPRAAPLARTPFRAFSSSRMSMSSPPLYEPKTGLLP